MDFTRIITVEHVSIRGKLSNIHMLLVESFADVYSVSGVTRVTFSSCPALLYFDVVGWAAGWAIGHLGCKRLDVILLVVMI